MARTRFSVSTEGELALTAATAKTVLQVASPANIGVAIRGLAVSFDGTSGAAEPGSVELVIQTSAGTMTAATPQHDDRRATGLTIQTAAQKNATAEPTDSGVILRDWHVHPQTGVEFRWWLDEEIVIGGAAAVRVGVRCNMPAGVNARARLFCEE
jgi:hypothetical protein